MLTETDPGLARRRLWQLISPTLPVGAYSYSAGLEYAVEDGWLKNADDVADWLRGQLHHALARVDVPALARLYSAWRAEDAVALNYWSQWLRACRETAELREEDRHVGQALARLLRDLDLPEAAPWAEDPLAGWAPLYALAVVRWAIPLEEAVEAYLWAWCENQVAAAIKLVPLGQTAGQRLLLELADPVGEAARLGLALDDEDMGGGLPSVALASSLHETQYSRLFRS